MKSIYFLLPSFVLISICGCSQTNSQSNQRVGGGCEGCEAIHESPVAFERLNSTIYLPDYKDAGPKIEISGIVYQKDGKTPAKEVVIYVYHTDQTGVYPKKGDEKGWGKRHGYIRGWMKTDENGFYKFYTLRPAAYPGRRDPQHIHISIKEPDKNEYWVDAYLFDDDPLLTTSERNKLEDRGGSGIVKLEHQKNGISKSIRNIILGLNVPNYPK